MTDDTTEARTEQFLRTLTDMANANMALMDGTTAPFEKLIREHDVVFGVWQDDTFPGGIDVYTIKGRHKLAECGITGITPGQHDRNPMHRKGASHRCRATVGRQGQLSK